MTKKPAAIPHTPGWSFPVSRTDPQAPPAEYRTADAGPRRVPLAYGGHAWLVTDYRQSKAVLSDHETFSSDATRPGYPDFPLSSKRPIPGHFLSMDPPDHTRLRRLVASEFSAGQVRSMRLTLASSAASLVNSMIETGSPADLVATIATPLPAQAAAAILGTPLRDRDFFLECTRDLQRHDATPVQRSFAAGRLNRYLRRLFSGRRNQDGNGLFDRLARQADTPQGPTMDEVVGLANLIVVAGLETTAALISLTMLSLLTDPTQGALVRAEPDRYAAPAVAEALRFWTLVQHGVARVATRDAQLADQRVQAGDGLIVHVATANRDPAVFDSPDRFDLTRRATGHLAFGHGIHRCLGAPLAQTQAELAVAELMRRLPGLRLDAPDTAPTHLSHMLVYGLRDLQVQW
jgi:cytochrome P450